MSLINSQYPLFTSGDFNLYLQKLDYDFTKVLDAVCVNVEKKMLASLLGDVTYLDYENNPATYQELIDGYKIPTVEIDHVQQYELAPYEYLGKKRVFRGVKDMLAYFTYFYYAQNKYNFNPTTEEKTSDTDRVNVTQNMYDAYYLGYKLYYDAYYYIKYKQSLGEYSDWEFSDIELANNLGI